jgi:tetratricopeptide (TPR) repeat protein
MVEVFPIVLAVLALAVAAFALWLQRAANQRQSGREEHLREQLKQQVALLGQERQKETDAMRANLTHDVEKMLRRSEIAINDIRENQTKAQAKMESERQNYLAAIKEEEGRLQAVHAESMEKMESMVSQLNLRIEFLQKELATRVEEMDRKILEGALIDKFILLLTSDADQANTLIKGIRLMTDDERFAQMTLGFPSAPAVAELRRIAAENESDTIFGALLQIADLHIAKSELVEAKAILSEMLDRCGSTAEVNPRKATAIIVRFARICRALHETKGAEPLYKIASGLVKRLDQSCLADMLHALELLAEVYRADGQYDKVEQIYKRIHESHMSVGDPEGMGVAKNLCDLAELCTAQQRHAEAEPAYQKALQIFVKHDLVTEPEGLRILFKLIDVYVSLKQIDDAALITSELIEHVRAAKKAEMLEKVVAKTITIADLAQQDGMEGEAGELCEQALQAADEIDGDNGKAALDLLSQLVMIYADGPPDKLIPASERLLTASEAVRGEDDKRNLQLIKNLAALYTNNGQAIQAEIVLKKAIDLIPRAFNKDRSEQELMDVKAILSDLYRDQGRYPEAQSVCEEVLELSEKHPGNEQENIIRSLSNLGLAFMLGKDPDGAERAFKRELELVEQSKGRSHLDTVAPLMHLAGLYLNARRYKDAEPCYQRVLNIRTTKLGPDHMDVLSSLVHLAELKRIQNELEPAQDFYERALRLVDKLFGPRDSRVADMLDRCAEIARQRGQDDKAATQSGRAKRIRELSKPIEQSEPADEAAIARESSLPPVDAAESSSAPLITPEQSNSGEQSNSEQSYSGGPAADGQRGAVQMQFGRSSLSVGPAAPRPSSMTETLDSLPLELDASEAEESQPVADPASQFPF